ncbi:MAG: hypothetical protein V1740_02520 [Candidatus Woesearchaeota archaeon]
MNGKKGYQFFRNLLYAGIITASSILTTGCHTVNSIRDNDIPATYESGLERAIYKLDFSRPKSVRKGLKEAYFNVDLADYVNSRVSDNFFGELDRISGEERGYVSKKLPFVNIDDPTIKDYLFIHTFGEIIEAFLEYQDIDMRNLTDRQKKLIAEYDKNLEKEEGLSRDDIEFIEEVPGVHPDRINNRDKVYLMEIAYAIAFSVMP